MAEGLTVVDLLQTDDVGVVLKHLPEKQVPATGPDHLLFRRPQPAEGSEVSSQLRESVGEQVYSNN